MEKDSLLDLIFRLKANCIAGEARFMEETGLSPAEYKGIAAMNPDERMNGSAVSRKMELSVSRGSRVIERMVKNGYIIRENCTDDRRKCTVYLAPKGIEIKEKIEAFKNSCTEKIHHRLSPEEIDTFSQSIKKVLDVI